MILAFDLGASRIRIALVEEGELGQVVIAETDSSVAGFAKFLGALQEVAGEHKIKAVVGGFPGQLEGDEGRLVFANNLPEWEDIPVKARIAELLDCEVYITNDVMLCGLGESHDGSGIAEGVMAYFTVSTGVNAVRIVDGRIDATIGRYEIGEQLVPDANGKAVWLESMVGGAALTKKLGKHPAQIKDRAFWRGIGERLAEGLYNTVTHWDPDVIVLGGSMMKDIDLEVLRSELLELGTEWPRQPELRRAELGSLGGLHGAVIWYDQLMER